MTLLASEPQLGVWWLWLLVAVLGSLVVALVAAILKARTGAAPAEAALSGGKAFAQTMGTLIMILIARKLL